MTWGLTVGVNLCGIVVDAGADVEGLVWAKGRCGEG